MPELMLSVVIPVYCEETLIRESLATIHDTLQALDISCELIVIDDGSTDDTWEQVIKLQEAIPILRAQRFSRNFGKESAILAGLSLAKGQAVIVMDSDLQHPPALIPQMVELWQASDADIVETVRMRPAGESVVRKLGARIFYTLMYALTDYDLSRMTDYKLMNRRVVDAWLALGEYNRFYRGLVAWLGFKRVEISFTVPARPDGTTSSWSLRALTKFAMQAIVSFSSRPLQVITFAGIGFFVFAVFMALRVGQQMLNGSAISGFATVILLQLIIGSLMMLGMGIIGVYIATIYNEVKGRPHYIVRDAFDMQDDETSELSTASIASMSSSEDEAQ
ncbi:MAG: glycosyltransferase family 2 protein [Chloroflexota bacterium]